MNKENSSLSDDLLEGAEAIAQFLYGDTGKKKRVYYLVRHGELPVFRLGEVIHARKSVLCDFILKREVGDF
jgi:hypothetical protein